MGRPVFPLRAAEPEILEWTISEAPFAERPETFLPAPATLPARPPLNAPSRPVWRLVAGAVLLVLAGLALARGGRALLQEWELRGLVAAEERAALQGDTGALGALSDPAGGPWLAQRLDRVDAGQPAPLPIVNLRPSGEPGRPVAISGPAPETLPDDGWRRVDVARTYVAPDGQRYAFALPQFYRRTAAGWRRVAGPPDFWGAPVTVAGRRLSVSVAAVDEAYARELLPELEALLERACAELACPARPISLTFSYNSYQRPELAELRPGDPLLLGLLPPVVTRFPDYALLWPSPHDVGYPLDAAGRALLHRALATQLLFAAVDRAAFGGGSREAVGNAFFFALTARLAVRYGLDAPEVLDAEPDPLPEVLDAQEYWDFRFGVWRRPDITRTAGRLLKGWLAGQPPEAELNLLRALPRAASLAGWLAAGLGLPAEAAEERVAAGLSRLPPAQPPSEDQP